MSLKDTARSAAALDTLHKTIGNAAKDARQKLEDELRAEKEKTGTQKVGISLAEGNDVGTASLVQPNPAAVITDEDAFKAWVIGMGDRFASEIERKWVTEIRKSFTDLLLKQMTAAGVAQWADPSTGEIHDVPGVEMQGRAAYTRLTVPDEGKAAIAAAWRAGTLELPGMTPPAAIESGDATELHARIAELEERVAWLDALEAAGVDNWEGQDHARELFNGSAE